MGKGPTFCEKAQSIGGVASDAAINGLDIFPIALRRLDLKASYVLRE